MPFVTKHGERLAGACLSVGKACGVKTLRDAHHAVSDLGVDLGLLRRGWKDTINDTLGSSRACFDLDTVIKNVHGRCNIVVSLLKDFTLDEWTHTNKYFDHLF